MIYFLAIMILVGGAHIAYSSNLQDTTQWLGRKISEKKIIKTTTSSFSTPLEIQAMITPPKQKIRILVTFLLYLGTIGISFSITWWASIVALIALVACSSIFSIVCLPRKMEFWIKQVSIGLQNRISNYEKEGDHTRAESLSGFMPILDEWIEFSKRNELDVNKIKTP